MLTPLGVRIHIMGTLQWAWFTVVSCVVNSAAIHSVWYRNILYSVSCALASYNQIAEHVSVFIAFDLAYVDYACFSIFSIKKSQICSPDFLVNGKMKRL